LAGIEYNRLDALGVVLKPIRSIASLKENLLPFGRIVSERIHTSACSERDGGYPESVGVRFATRPIDKDIVACTFVGRITTKIDRTDVNPREIKYIRVGSATEVDRVDIGTGQNEHIGIGPPLETHRIDKVTQTVENILALST